MSIVWKGFAGTPDTPGDYWHDAMIQDLLAGLPGWFDPNLLITPGHFRDVEAINDWLDGDWIVWILGDEEGDCPFWDVDAPVWKQFPNPHRPYWPDRVLPLGYTPHTRPALGGRGVPPKGGGRWVLSGQNTNQRRKDAFTALELINPDWINPSPTFAGGIPADEFIHQLWEADWAPSPAGNVRADSFRMWEALEAGAVPILDSTTPAGDRNIWADTLGDHPFPVVKQWDEVGAILATPAPFARSGVWYTKYKRDLRQRLMRDWAELTGIRPWDPPQIRITTIVTASPVPSDPDFSMLQETVESVRSRLPNEICIAFDGSRQPNPEYEELIRRVAYHANLYWPEVWLHYSGTWKHQAGTLKDVMAEIDSGAVLVLEHDTPLTGTIPFDDLVVQLYVGAFNHIRLHYDDSIHPEHEYLMRGRDRHFWKTVQYSQRPHVALTDYYRDLLAIIPDSARTYVEDCVYGPLVNSPWEHNKLGIYAPPGSIKRSYHLDGRQGVAKPEFWF